MSIKYLKIFDKYCRIFDTRYTNQTLIFAFNIIKKYKIVYTHLSNTLKQYKYKIGFKINQLNLNSLDIIKKN